MEKEILEQLNRIEQKLDFMYDQTEKSKQMKKISLIVTLILFVLPVILLLVMLPKIMGNMTSQVEMFL
jgi:TRAP-type mannitol/chloroaromatic compound transport system permease small subunit